MARGKVRTKATAKAGAGHPAERRGETIEQDSNSEPAKQQFQQHSSKRNAHRTASHAVVGLINLGNTCFFNSSLQLLLACMPLTQRLVGQNTANGSPKGSVFGRGPLGYALQQAVMHVHGPGTPSTYNPQALFAAICRHAPRFKGRQQQDSHELLRILLDGLENEEKGLHEMTRRRSSIDMDTSSPAACSPATLQPASSPPVPASSHHPRQADSGASYKASTTLVDLIFGGVLASTVQCGACGHQSVTYEPFFDLSLPIPRPASSPGATEACSSAASGKQKARGGRKKKGQPASDAPPDHDVAGLNGVLPQLLEGSEEGPLPGSTGAGDAAADTSSVDHAAAPQGRKKLTPKQRRKLLTEERRHQRFVKWRQKRKKHDLELSEDSQADKEDGDDQANSAASGVDDQEAAAAFPDPTSMAGPASMASLAMPREQSLLHAVQQACGASLAAAATAQALQQGLWQHGTSSMQMHTVGHVQQASQLPPTPMPSPNISFDGTGLASVQPCPSSSTQTSALQRAPTENMEDVSSRGRFGQQHVMVTRSKARKLAHSGLTDMIQSIGLASSSSNSGGDRRGPARPAATTQTNTSQQPDASSSQMDLDTISTLTAPPHHHLQQPLHQQHQPLAQHPGSIPIHHTQQHAHSTEPIAHLAKTGTSPMSQVCTKIDTLTLLERQQQQQQARATPPQGQATASSAPPEPGTSSSSAAARAPAPHLHLTNCLSAFFQPESITWECPKEASEQSGLRSRSTSLGGDTCPIRKQVSWSEHHMVHMVPGSSEQRGTDLQLAMQGLQPFCRPARCNGCTCLVSAQLDSTDNSIMRIWLSAGSSRRAEALLPQPLELGEVDVSVAWRHNSSEQTAAVLAVAQAVMDCIADIVSRDGIRRVKEMVGQGLRVMQLRPGEWQVHGLLPEELSQMWTYPFASSSEGDAAEAGGREGGGLQEEAVHGQQRQQAQSRGGGAVPVEPEGMFVMDDCGDPTSAGPSLDPLPRLPSDPVHPECRHSGLLGGQEEHTDEHPESNHHHVNGQDKAVSHAGHLHPQPPLQPPQPSSNHLLQHMQASAPRSVPVLEPSIAGVSSPFVQGHSPIGLGPMGHSPVGHSPRSGGTRQPRLALQRPAVKTYRVQHLPTVLLLHLKRFQQDARGRLTKVAVHVDFDLQLDLSPYVATGSCSSSPQQQLQPCLQYDLVGLVEHRGQMRFGHYVAYVKRPTDDLGAATAVAVAAAATAVYGGAGSIPTAIAPDTSLAEQWFYISDTSVKPVTAEQVARAQAYLLMYVQRSN